MYVKYFENNNCVVAGNTKKKNEIQNLSNCRQ